MANKMSVKKSHRSSLKKQKHNLFWKKAVADAKKTLSKALSEKNPTTDILRQKEISLQKALDKAAKVKAIHKNKANRLKSRYAKRITAQTSTQGENATDKSVAAKKQRGKTSKPNSKSSR